MAKQNQISSECPDFWESKMDNVIKSQQDIIPPIESVLENIGLDSAKLKLMKPGLRRTHCRAVITWLTKYKYMPESTNIEKVRGLLGAFHHLCEIEAWEEAYAITELELNTPAKEMLRNQLLVWNRHLEVVDLCIRLLHHSDNPSDMILFNDLGTICRSIGDYNRALAYYEQSLKIARDLQERQTEGNALSNMGYAYYYLFKRL